MGVKYVVVENAGYEGERDIGEFESRRAAEKWLNRTYGPGEIETLHVDVCMEKDGERTYDPHGFS